MKQNKTVLLILFIRNELKGVYYGITFIPDKAIPFLNSLSRYSLGFRHSVRSDFGFLCSQIRCPRIAVTFTPIAMSSPGWLWLLLLPGSLLLTEQLPMQKFLQLQTHSNQLEPGIQNFQASYS